MAFLFSALIFIISSVGDFFKIKFRSEPFSFRDIGSLGAAFKIAGNYELSVNNRIVFAVILIIAAFLLLFLFARGKPCRKFRICAVLAVALSV